MRASIISQTNIESYRTNRQRASMNQKQPPLRLLSLGIFPAKPRFFVFSLTADSYVILCLDGGGVRGYSMIMILQELMLKLFVEMHGRAPSKEEVPKPCDHFDLIGGTGTGGYVLCP